MPRFRLAAAVAAAALVPLLLTACSGTASTGASGSDAAADGTFPVTITHALGETTIEAKPERVATISWGNQDVALALGVTGLVYSAGWLVFAALTAELFS